jgi:rod shape-determining protein MreC
VLFCLVLIFCDHRYQLSNSPRKHLGFIVVGIGQVVNLPIRIFENTAHFFTGHKSLIKHNEQLQSELQLINKDLERLRFLEMENAELRKLLNVIQPIKGKVITAEAVGHSTSKFTQSMVIDRGERYGVFVGQPVFDAYGLLGQIIMVKPDESLVMLITNNKSAIPALVQRNGLQTIVMGTGNNDYLELANITETTDIKPGDVMVTSDLNKVFPSGYKVGIIKEIKKIPGERFVRVLVTPEAHLDQSRLMFLISPSNAKLRDK